MRASQRARWRAFFRDHERKPLSVILAELAECTLRERELPNHYFANLLYKRGCTDFRDHVGLRKCLWLMTSPEVHDPDLTGLLDDKVRFHDLMVAHGIRTPRILAHNSGLDLIAKGKLICCSGPQELHDRLSEIAQEAGQRSVFIKPVSGESGEGCEKVALPDLDPESRGVTELWPQIVEGQYIFQESIAQHPDLDRVHPMSVNSIRIDTYLPPQGKPEAISARFRFGANGSVMDNTSQGGGSIKVDLTTGRLGKLAIQGLEHGAGRFAEHPDTGVLFREFRIPMFDKAKHLAKECARVIPNTLVGWDVALQSDGPTVIEGNWNYNIPRQQAVCGGVRANPVFGRVLERYGL